jgi:uncharacterized membrane protein
VTHLRVRIDRLAVGLGVLAILVIGLDFAGLPMPLIRPVLVFATVTLVPGALLLTILGYRPEINAWFTIHSVALSVVSVVLCGLALNMIVPHGGQSRPFSIETLLFGFTLLIAFLIALTQSVGDDNKTFEIAVPKVSDLDPIPVLFLLLPPVTVLSVHLLNVASANQALLVTMFVLALIPLAVALERVPRRWYSLGVWCMALSILYHKSFWINYGFSGQGAAVMFWRLGQWDPTANGLVENGVLFPVYARLLGINILTQMEIINPILISGLIPVVMFVTFRRLASDEYAFFGASIFVFAHPFYLQYPTAGRAATPVFFLVLIGSVLVDTNLRDVHRRLFKLVFAAGIVATHYGTSYVALFMLTAAFVILTAYSILDSILDRYDIGTRYNMTRGIGSDAQESTEKSATDGRRRYIQSINRWFRGHLTGRRITVSFLLFYTTVTASWYMYTFEQKQFNVLIQFIIKTAQTFLGVQDIGGGSTATRIATDYGSISIQISKWLYGSLMILIGIGLFRTYYVRFLSDKRCSIPDEYLAVASCVVGVFTGSVLIPGSWGGGRPLMIVFSLSSIFAVLGADQLGQFFRLGVTRLGSAVSSVPAENIDARSATRLTGIGLGLFLMLFLLINTGTGAALGLGETAPSRVPIVNESADTFRETDIQTHVWFVNHRSQAYRIYGDRNVYGQVDWYSPQIASRKESPRTAGYQIKPVNNGLKNFEDANPEAAYVVLVGENVVRNRYMVTHNVWNSTKPLQDDFDQTNKVFTTGRSDVLQLDTSN